MLGGAHDVGEHDGAEDSSLAVADRASHDEALQLVEQAVGVAQERPPVLPLQLDEARFGDRVRQAPAPGHGVDPVPGPVQHLGGDRDRIEDPGDVGRVQEIDEPCEGSRTRRMPLQAREGGVQIAIVQVGGCHVFVQALFERGRSERLLPLGVVLRDRFLGVALLELLLALGERCRIERQGTNPTRGRRGQHGAELPALVVPEQRCLLRADGIEHAQDILDRVLEGRQLMPWEPVGHAHTAPVDRDEARPTGEPLQERGGLRELPHHLDVGDVPLDVDEVDRAVPDDAVGDRDVAVPRVLGAGGVTPPPGRGASGRARPSVRARPHRRT